MKNITSTTFSLRCTSCFLFFTKPFRNRYACRTIHSDIKTSTIKWSRWKMYAVTRQNRIKCMNASRQLQNKKREKSNPLNNFSSRCDRNAIRGWELEHYFFAVTFISDRTKNGFWCAEWIHWIDRMPSEWQFHPLCLQNDTNFLHEKPIRSPCIWIHTKGNRRRKSAIHSQWKRNECKIQHQLRYGNDSLTQILICLYPFAKNMPIQMQNWKKKVIDSVIICRILNSKRQKEAVFHVCALSDAHQLQNGCDIGAVEICRLDKLSACVYSLCCMASK